MTGIDDGCPCACVGQGSFGSKADWFLLFSILGPGVPGHDAPERVLWEKNTCDLDTRLVVDFDMFKRGSEAERRKMFSVYMRR